MVTSICHKEWFMDTEVHNAKLGCNLPHYCTHCRGRGLNGGCWDRLEYCMGPICGILDRFSCRLGDGPTPAYAKDWVPKIGNLTFRHKI